MEGITRESLRPLLDLQRVDVALDKLAQRKADLPEQSALDEFTASRIEAQKSMADRQAEFDKAAHEQARLEAEVTSIQDKISHESARLYSGEISNPKELAAIQAELDGLRRRKNHVEDQLLEALEARETAEAALDEVKTALADFDSKISDATAARDTASVEIEKELAELGQERGTIVPTLPEEAVELYETLCTKKYGVAAAPLTPGGVCRGCGVSLSPLALDKIKRSGDEIIRCENCRRILVL